MRKMFLSESVGPSSRGRLLRKWKDRVKGYMCERGATRRSGFEQARKKCFYRERWGIFCRGHALGGL